MSFPRTAIVNHKFISALKVWEKWKETNKKACLFSWEGLSLWWFFRGEIAVNCQFWGLEAYLAHYAHCQPRSFGSDLIVLNQFHQGQLFYYNFPRSGIFFLSLIGWTCFYFLLSFFLCNRVISCLTALLQSRSLITALPANKETFWSDSRLASMEGRQLASLENKLVHVQKMSLASSSSLSEILDAFSCFSMWRTWFFERTGCSKIEEQSMKILKHLTMRG